MGLCEARWPSGEACGWGTCNESLGECLCDEGYTRDGPLNLEPSRDCDYHADTVRAMLVTLGALNGTVVLACLVRTGVFAQNTWDRYRANKPLMPDAKTRRTMKLNTLLFFAFSLRCVWNDLTLVGLTKGGAVIGKDSVVTITHTLSEASFWLAAYYFIEVFIEYTLNASKSAGVTSSGSSGLMGKLKDHAVRLRQLGIGCTLLANLCNLLALSASNVDTMSFARELYLTFISFGAAILIYLSLLPTISVLIDDMNTSLSSGVQGARLAASSEEGSTSGDSSLPRKKSGLNRMGSSVRRISRSASATLKRKKKSNKIAQILFNLRVFRVLLILEGLALLVLNVCFISWPYLHNKMLYLFMFIWTMMTPLCMLTFVIFSLKRERNKLSIVHAVTTRQRKPSSASSISSQ